MIVEFYTDDSFKVEGEPEEITEYLALMRKKQDEYELQQIKFNILEAIRQIKEKKNGNKHR